MRAFCQRAAPAPHGRIWSTGQGTAAGPPPRRLKRRRPAAPLGTPRRRRAGGGRASARRGRVHAGRPRPRQLPPAAQAQARRSSETQKSEPLPRGLAAYWECPALGPTWMDCRKYIQDIFQLIHIKMYGFFNSLDFSLGCFPTPTRRKKSPVFLVHVAGVLKKTFLAVRLAPYAVGGRPPALC